MKNKLKLTKTILEKKTKKKEKKPHGETLQQSTVFLRKNYRAKFSTSSILKKIKLKKIILKKKRRQFWEKNKKAKTKKKNKEKNMW